MEHSEYSADIYTDYSSREKAEKACSDQAVYSYQGALEMLSRTPLLGRDDLTCAGHWQVRDLQTDEIIYQRKQIAVRDLTPGEVLALR